MGGMSNIILAVLGIYDAYLVYRFLKILFQEKRVGTLGVFLFAGCQYLLTTALYFFVQYPIVNLISNLVAIFLMTFIFKGKLLKRFMAVAIVYVFFMLNEICIALLTGYVITSPFAQSEYNNLFGQICAKLSAFILVALISNFKNIRRNEKIPLGYWFCIYVFPVCTILVCFYIFSEKSIPPTVATIGIIIFIVENLFAFFLYDNIVSSLIHRNEMQLEKQKNENYLEQFEQINMYLQSTRAMRHDIRNHLISLNYLVKNEKYGEIKDYLNKMSEISWLNASAVVDTGNSIIDGIMNCKIFEAQQRNIEIEPDFAIPKELTIASADLTILLGNLMDNAIAAVEELPEESRKVTVGMRYDKEALYIKMYNPYQGELETKDGQIVTKKTDKANHGIGLHNITNMVKRYKGDIDIETKDNIFAVSVMILCHTAKDV